MTRRRLASFAAIAALLLLGFGPTPRALATDPVLAASGDIACAPGAPSDPWNCQQSATAGLISARAPTAVAELGDEQYTQGLLSQFQGTGAYGDTWRSFNPISHPVPGNHEYAASSTADGYFQYFGSVAVSRNGYYSYELGGWHIVALNSNCGDGTSGATVCANHDEGDGTVTSDEVQWLKNDLAAHQGQCTLAYWHHPLFTKGYTEPSPGVRPLWDALYAHGADVVLNGHDHVYERYAQLAPGGTTDSVRGVREFVAGEGGFDLNGFPSAPTAPVEASDGAHFGVLFLSLHGSSYDWSFDSAGATSTALDKSSSSVGCHEPTISPAASSSPSQTGQSVSFDAHASVHDGAAITGYAWDFGDGSTSTQTTPSHSYTAAGSYTVSVKVSASNGVSTTKTLTVNVTDRPPVASFTAVPSSAPTGQAIGFDGSASSDPDGSVSSYSWDFGDGSTGSGATPSHGYATAGVYTVKLRVVDNSGSSDSSTRQVTITDRPPVASFTAVPSSAPTGQAIGFDGSASSDPDGSVSSYSWDFGDGSTGSGATPNHGYATAGVYTVKLTVVDNSGNSDSSTRQVTVTDRPPAASFTAVPSSAPTGQAIGFDGSASSDPDGSVSSYSWDFGDGSTGSGQQASHSYTTAGDYMVKLTVTDNSGSTGTTTHAITVSAVTSSQTQTSSPSSTQPSAGHTFSIRQLDRQVSRVVRHGLRLRFSSARAGRITVRITTKPAKGHPPLLLGKHLVSLPGDGKPVVVVIRLNRHMLHTLGNRRVIHIIVTGRWEGASAASVLRRSLTLRS